MTGTCSAEKSDSDDVRFFSTPFMVVDIASEGFQSVKDWLGFLQLMVLETQHYSVDCNKLLLPVFCLLLIEVQYTFIEFDWLMLVGEDFTMDGMLSDGVEYFHMVQMGLLNSFLRNLES